jgi:Na+/melibiose symporter-like transporter
MREIYQIVIFFLLRGLLNPTFEEFTYFFLLNVIGISKFMFALLVLIGQIAHVAGALIYKAFFRSTETRTMIAFAIASSVITNFMNFSFAKRWNLSLGIPDLVFLLFTDVIFNVISTLVFSLPLLALFAKITPKKIEGTTFAFLTGTMNLASSVIAPAVGTFINHKFVGVHKRDLSHYSTLILIQLIGSILTFILLPLVPSRE